jgi:hypothetical protein
MQAVRQVVFTDVLIVGQFDVEGLSRFRYKINRITAAIGVILAFTGKKMFYFNKKSEGPPENSKTSCCT